MSAENSILARLRRTPDRRLKIWKTRRYTSVDYGLQNGYKIQTRYKAQTGKYELGIKHGLGIKRGCGYEIWTTDYVCKKSANWF